MRNITAVAAAVRRRDTAVREPIEARCPRATAAFSIGIDACTLADNGALFFVGLNRVNYRAESGVGLWRRADVALVLLAGAGAAWRSAILLRPLCNAFCLKAAAVLALFAVRRACRDRATVSQH